MSTPLRTCIVCRKKSCKEDFIRITRTNDGITPDPNGKAEGRGAYICRNQNCIDALLKRKALDRAFRKSIPERVYRELTEELKAYEE